MSSSMMQTSKALVMVAPALAIVALAVVLLVAAMVSERFGAKRRNRNLAIWIEGPNAMATGRIHYSRRFLRELKRRTKTE